MDKIIELALSCPLLTSPTTGFYLMLVGICLGGIACGIFWGDVYAAILSLRKR